MIVLLSSAQLLESVPLPEEYQHSVDNYAKDHDEDFMIRNGVTQEEIIEFHRLRKFFLKETERMFKEFTNRSFIP